MYLPLYFFLVGLGPNQILRKLIFLSYTYQGRAAAQQQQQQEPVMAYYFWKHPCSTSS